MSIPSSGRRALQFVIERVETILVGHPPRVLASGNLIAERA
jgi:hypothetical protein